LALCKEAICEVEGFILYLKNCLNSLWLKPIASGFTNPRLKSWVKLFPALAKVSLCLCKKFKEIK
jgi:hypothetical protein